MSADLVNGASATARPAAQAGRLDWLDVAKGLGIILVVYGHAVGGLRGASLIAPNGAISASFLFVYTFHMPMFMFLSGLLVERRLVRGRLSFVRSLGKSLLLPYIIWAPIAILVLTTTGGLTNGGSVDIVRSLLSIFWSPPGWLWFFLALIMCHISAAIIPSGRFGFILFCLFIFPLQYMFTTPELFHQTIHIILFYGLGVMMGPSLTTAPVKGNYYLAAAMAVIFACSASFVWLKGYSYMGIEALPAALSGSILLICASRFAMVRSSNVFGFIGKRTMPIYVLHIFFIAGLRIVLDKLLGFREGGLMLPVLCLTGVVGPLAVFEIASRLRLSEWIGLGAAPRAPRADSLATAGAGSAR